MKDKPMWTEGEEIRHLFFSIVISEFLYGFYFHEEIKGTVSLDVHGGPQN